MRTSSDAFVFRNEIAQEPAGEGIVRQVLGFGEPLMLVRAEFEEGAVGYVHAHEHTQVTYIQSGEFDVVIDGVEKRLGPGDSFYVAPNLEHGAVCKKAGVLLDVFSPMREDFLNESNSK